jgi:uncharacterized protein (DUF433 family)
MARYPLNLPGQLKQDAEVWANKQGVSLNQFILWAVSEKVGSLNQLLDDPDFPSIAYRRGSSGVITPIIRGTAVRVQTIVIANQQWEMSSDEIAREYDLKKAQVKEALAFYQAHTQEIDLQIAAEAKLEAEASG